jgi:hypothetical protein
MIMTGCSLNLFSGILLLTGTGTFAVFGGESWCPRAGRYLVRC